MTPLLLSDCGDTLTPDEVWRVIRISRTQYYELRRHNCFPIKPLPGLGVTRYAKVAVEAYLASSRGLTMTAKRSA